ncbi:MAG: AmmeMemoRadiSam system protein A [Treponema sp.]|nr:AmmeMemoRadiSam system protein A [Treponema sp.]MCL2271900.1 AmmeMemoRadiSam system protein A [Treponema sp.]
MEFLLSAEEKKILLHDARETMSAELEKRKPVYSDLIKSSSNLNEPCGAFVSLHDENRQLRGCIGSMAARLPLIQTVRAMAKEAAFGDPRFPPLKKEELPRCHIEISVLSPMIPCPDPRQVKVGVHGLYLKRGGRSGVLLPQVPVEQGWDLKQYLDYICIKAGLPPLSYKEPDAELLTFTAVVFSEE